MTTMPLSDLHEEAAKIAKRDSFYAEVTALHTHATGLTPSIARMALSPRTLLTPIPNWLPMPQNVPPNTPPPRYANQTPAPCTPTQNTPALNDNPHASPTNPFQATLNMNQGNHNTTGKDPEWDK